ncbi:MAG: hypothetical protein HRT35_11100 [Algicola sp.]|nr:hypothetical protein [Algicola sp.]
MTLTKYLKALFTRPSNSRFMIFLLFVIGTSGVHAKNQHENHSLVGSHGMVLLHDQQTGLYASHLPLYSKPHNYQIIYKIQTANDHKIKAMFKKGMVTLLPQRFDLQKLINGETLTLETQFFAGHFERGGKQTSTEKVTFVKKILVEKIQPNYQAESAIFYVAPISANSAIIAHKIQQAPSFDAIGFIALSNDAQLKTRQNNGCRQPKSKDRLTIQKQLNSCGLTTMAYFETADFKK